MIDITNYQSLLAVGRLQQEPQRFLFVFLQSSLSQDHTETDKQRFQSGLGGELEPIMCVDKNLSELTTFADLVTESKQMEQAWSMVLIACLAGKNGIPPTAIEAKPVLELMVQTVHSGSDLSKYLAFDTQGDLLHFS
ncbi:MAG: ribonucleotide reductase subunit alpha [Candidatus Izimaplasma sp.]|nr:ribonucleotide reductase subunit alpha [Candidatus Izimaplasma bacterium]